MRGEERQEELQSGRGTDFLLDRTPTPGYGATSLTLRHLPHGPLLPGQNANSWIWRHPLHGTVPTGYNVSSWMWCHVEITPTFRKFLVGRLQHDVTTHKLMTMLTAQVLSCRRGIRFLYRELLESTRFRC